MALLQSLALSAAGARLLRDENDTAEQVAARGISYILFYAIFGNLVRWSYGFTLLVPKDPEETTDPHDDKMQGFQQIAPRQQSRMVSSAPPPSGSLLIDVDQPITPGPTPESDTLASQASQSIDDRPYQDNSDDEEEIDNASVSSQQQHQTRFSLSKYWKKHHEWRSTLLHSLSSSTSEARPTPWSFRRRGRHNRNMRDSTRQTLKRKAATVVGRIRQVLTPPLLTAVLALVIGLVPALHRFVMSPESKFYAFIVHPIEGCGAAAIPMILLCLGAQVVHFASSSTNTPATVGSGNSPASSSTRPGPPQRRRSAITPSIFPHAIQGDTSSEESSSGEDMPNQGWLRVSLPSRIGRRPYGPGGIASSRSNASSTATLFHFAHYDGDGNDDDSEDGDSSGLTRTQSQSRMNDVLAMFPSFGYRFKWITPVSFILIARLVIVPLICLPAILFHPSSLSPVLTMDPTFTLTLVLLAAAPTAINMIQLCQIKEFFEDSMAAVLFWSYCVFGVPCVLAWSLVGLWAAGR
ncbi:hypothetical protein BGW38_002972 [Lunasporangiospora selenospora]|uniref:Membrane transport protein n=1 Tax=Lunasporangiospora selenospora TaxID=979761 RepID=A0A9P6G1E7_9FUNG|nr:hypothetical protein BGW38_002972 [Lunasporangiospora selenospora]